MDTVEFTFLGTSSGTPTKNRNVSGLALSAGGRGWFLVDCGEGTQHQLLHVPYSLHNLQAIFITHVHGDHCYGLPGLLSSASLSGRKKPLPIIGPKEIKPLIETIRELTQLRLTYDIEFVSVETANHWAMGGLSVEWVALSHRVPSYAYVFTEREQKRELLVDKIKAVGVPPGPQWSEFKRQEFVQLADGRRLRSSDFTVTHDHVRRIVVGGDNDQPELLRDACQEAQVLIHEATYTEDVALKVGSGPQHSSAASVAQFAQSVGLPHLFLTHFSPRYADPGVSSPSLADIEREARRYYQHGLYLARDLERYRLTPSGDIDVTSDHLKNDSENLSADSEAAVSLENK